MDYLIPTAMEIPEIEIHAVRSSSWPASSLMEQSVRAKMR
jgi:CO/xanthine dehydrogenase Mo-binding subunit